MPQGGVRRSGAARTVRLLGAGAAAFLLAWPAAEPRAQESFFERALELLQGTEKPKRTPARRRVPKEPPPLPDRRPESGAALGAHPEIVEPLPDMDPEDTPSEPLENAATDTAGVALPERNPTRLAGLPTVPIPSVEVGTSPDTPDAEAEVLSTPSLPPHPSEVVAADWTEEEISAARTRCGAYLRDLDVTFEPLSPKREGQCGAPAAIKVTALGGDPAVTIAPGATLTCPMTAALSRWVRETLQPAARHHLGTRIVSLRNAASYVCRRRYDDASKRLSEHALANALDISALETESGETVSVADHWLVPSVEAAPSAADAPPASDASAAEAGTAVTAAVAAEVPQADEPDPKSAFLRAIHQGACKTFGTVLGPDANEAHKDHFHFDLKERNAAYCR